MSKVEWRPAILLTVLSLVGFLINASTFSSLGVVLPQMVAEEHWSWQQAGYGFTLLGACCGFSAFIPAYMIRKLGVRATLIAGSAVMAAGFAALASTQGLALYLLGTALCGVGYQMLALIPATHVLAAVYRHRGRPFGVYFTASALGGVAGPWMVWAVMHGYSDHWRVFWQIQMGLAAVMGAVTAALAGDQRWLTQAAERTDEAVAEEIVSVPHPRIWRTPVDWTPRAAFRTPQFYVLLAAYFGHLLIGVSVASMSVAHLTERGVGATLAGAMLSFESLVQTGGRALAGAVSDYLEPRLLLVFSLACLVVGAGALSVASTYPMMLLYAVGSGLGFGLTSLAVTVLLLNYFGRRHNLEIFSATCLIGGVSALGPTVGGALRDASGGFGSTFQIYAVIIAAVFVAATLMRPPKPREAAAAPSAAPAPRLARDPA